MRKLLCPKCALGLRPGERQTFMADTSGPDEYERVVVGTARKPLETQRRVVVIADGTEEVTYLRPDFYDCDTCGAPIRPGEPCVAHSAWTSVPVPAWEDAYMLREEEP